MTKIHDLRSALEFLETVPGQLLTSDTEVDPNAEVSGVYRHVGAGGTVARPTKEGPAMLFNNVKGFPDARVTIGMLASRKRVGMLLGTDPEFLGKYMGEKLKETIPPVMIPEGKHIDCQEVVHYATDPDFDLRTLVPAPTNTPEDAGPYITMGLCMGTDPENGTSDVTIHRLCIESRDELGMWITPGSRHLGAFFDKYCAQGKDMPISISIGLDPAVVVEGQQGFVDGVLALVIAVEDGGEAGNQLAAAKQDAQTESLQKLLVVVVLTEAGANFIAAVGNDGKLTVFFICSDQSI